MYQGEIRKEETLTFYVSSSVKVWQINEQTNKQTLVLENLKVILHRNKAKLENLKVILHRNKAKLKNLKVILHHNKAKPENLKSPFAPQ